MIMTPIQITHVNAGEWVSVEYSTITPFSKDNKWMILQHSGGLFGLYKGTGEFVNMLPTINHSSEPRWSSGDPDVLYYIHGREMIKHNVSTGAGSVYHIFSQYIDFTDEGANGVRGLGEGDIQNGLIALAGWLPNGSRDVFLFSTATNTQFGVLNLDPSHANGMDNVYATPSGNLQIGWYETGQGRFKGIELYDQNMNFVRQLATVMGHNDVGTYKGHDVLVWCSSADPAINKNAVVRIDNHPGPGTDPYTILSTYSWSYAFHVSCRQGLGFCLVSVYAPDHTLQVALPSLVFKVPLDGITPQTTICDTGAFYSDYNSTPRASLSRDGSRFVFTSNNNVFMVVLDEQPAPVPQPTPVPAPATTPDTWREIDFTPDEGREWRWEFKVVNGKMTVKVFEKVKS